MLGHASSDCAAVTQWDPKHTVSCSWSDPSGSKGTGICDPTDKLCYDSKVSFAQVIDFYSKTVVPTFITNSAINYFHAFDTYQSIDAVAAVSNGATLYISLLQV